MLAYRWKREAQNISKQSGLFIGEPPPLGQAVGTGNSSAGGAACAACTLPSDGRALGSLCCSLGTSGLFSLF